MDDQLQEAVDGSAVPATPADFDGFSTRSLLANYAAILAELVRRGVTRTMNAPAGDLAETLVNRVYAGELAPNSEKSWDVRAADGRLLQVKSRVIASVARTKPIQFSVFRSWGFDAAVFVVFAAETYEVIAAIELPTASVNEKAGDVAWVGGSRFTVSLAVLRSLSGAIDRTAEIAEVLEALD